MILHSLLRLTVAILPLGRAIWALTLLLVRIRGVVVVVCGAALGSVVVVGLHATLGIAGIVVGRWGRLWVLGRWPLGRILVQVSIGHWRRAWRCEDSAAASRKGRRTYF